MSELQNIKPVPRNHRPKKEAPSFPISQPDKKIKENKVIKLTNKQKRFCEEYIIDWNATRSAIAAGYSKKTAYSQGQRLLKNVEILAYIRKIKNDPDELERISGVSKIRLIIEARKMALSNIAHLHNSWVDLKEYEKLSEDEKACIRDISTTRAIHKGKEYVKQVQIKLHDKNKALEILARLFGFEAPKKVEHQLILNQVTKLIYDNMSETDLIKLSEIISQLKTENDD